MHSVEHSAAGTTFTLWPGPKLRFSTMDDFDRSDWEWLFRHRTRDEVVSSRSAAYSCNVTLMHLCMAGLLSLHTVWSTHDQHMRQVMGAMSLNYETRKLVDRRMNSALPAN